MDWQNRIKFPNFGRKYRNHHKLIVYRHYIVYFISESKHIEDILPDLRKTMISDNYEPDVEFLVGEEKFPAHKKILRISNEDFYIKFIEPFSDQREIEVEGVDPKGFQQFLRFCHFGDLNLNRLNMLPSYDVAVTYNHPRLLELCYQFICKNIQGSNVLEILDWNLKQQNYQIMKSCRGFFIENAIEVLTTSEQFERISKKLLKTILSWDVLNCSEKLLFEMTIKWGQVQCELTNVQPTMENIRSQLEDILYLIRLEITPELEVLNDFPINSRDNRFKKRNFDNLRIVNNIEETCEVIEASHSDKACYGFSVILSNPESVNDSFEHFLVTIECADELLFEKQLKIKTLDYLTIKDFVFERPVTMKRHKRHFLKVKFVDSHRSRYIEKDESSSDVRERIVRLYD